MKNKNLSLVEAKTPENTGGGNSYVWRYAAMVLMVLTLGIGNAWGTDKTFTVEGPAVSKRYMQDNILVSGTVNSKKIANGSNGPVFYLQNGNYAPLCIISKAVNIKKVVIYGNRDTGSNSQGTAFNLQTSSNAIDFLVPSSGFTAKANNNNSETTVESLSGVTMIGNNQTYATTVTVTFTSPVMAVRLVGTASVSIKSVAITYDDAISPTTELCEVHMTSATALSSSGTGSFVKTAIKSGNTLSDTESTPNTYYYNKSDGTYGYFDLGSGKTFQAGDEIWIDMMTTSLKPGTDARLIYKLNNSNSASGSVSVNPNCSIAAYMPTLVRYITKSTDPWVGQQTLYILRNDGNNSLYQVTIHRAGGSGGGDPTPSTYSVTYDGNGKTSGDVPTDDDSPYEEGATVTVLGNTGSLARTGYTFAGWNTKADGTGQDYAEDATFDMGTANVTLYAKWTLNLSTHSAGTYETAAGSGGYGLTLKTYSGRDYEIYTFNTSKLYAGSSVTSSDGKEMLTAAANTDVAPSDTWLLVRPNAVNNGGDYNSPDEFAFSSETDNDRKTHYISITNTDYIKLKVSGYDQFSFFGRDNGTGDGKKFVVKIDGAAQTFDHSGTDNTLYRFTISTGEHVIEVTAEGSNVCRLRGFSLRLPSYTLQYNANGGSGDAMANTTGTGTKTLRTNTYTKDGCSFAGWATSQANANAGTVAYTDGATNYSLSADATLYAVWKLNAPEISCEDNVITMTEPAGATVYYTTDGETTPTSSSTAYNSSSKPEIAVNTTFKAIAILANHVSSNVTTYDATYVASSCTDVDAPTDLEENTSERTTSAITFEWTAASNASSYDVKLWDNSSCTGDPIASGNVTTTSKEFTGLTEGTIYYCKVQSKGDGTTYCTAGGTTDAVSGTTATIPSHTVTAAVNNASYGSAEAVATSIKEGATTNVSATPNSGYRFVSWALSGDGAASAELSSTTANPTTLTMGTNNVTVTATFELIPTYTVTLNPNNGTIESYDGWTLSAGKYTKTVAEGTELALLEFTRSGYEFMTWRAGGVDKTSPITVSADIELKAIWGTEEEVTIYSWESPSGTAIEEGGTATHYNGDSPVEGNTRVNYSNTISSTTYYTISLNGKSDWSTDYIKISLDEVIKTGDTVKLTAYYNNSNNKTIDAKMKTAAGTEVFAGSGCAKNSPTEYKYTVPTIVDADELLMTRTTTETNCFITKLVITRTEVVEELDPAEQPTITTQPTGGTYAWNATTTQTVVASVTDGGTLSYQWYKKGDTDTKVGTNSASYTPTVSGTYYVIITNTKTGYAKTTKKSNEVSVTINERPSYKVAYYDGAVKLGEETVLEGAKPTHAGDYDELPMATFQGWFNDADLDPEHAVASISDEVITAATSYYSKWSKTYASSVDFVQFIADNTTSGDYATYLSTNGYLLTQGTGHENALDNSNAFDTGLKLKTSTDTKLQFNVAAGKIIKLTVGKINGMSIAINGAAATAIASGTDATHLGVSYYYSANPQAVTIAETAAKYNMLKVIKFLDPMTVTYDATTNGGSCATENATFTGSALTLPEATKFGWQFDGWFTTANDDSETGVLVGEAGDTYTPSANITLYARFTETTTLATLTDIKVNGTTVEGFAVDKFEYNIVLPYKTSVVPTVAYTKGYSGAAVTMTPSTITSVFGDVTLHVVSQDESNENDYVLHITEAPKDMLCLIQATHKNATEATITGYIGGTADKNTQGGSKLGSKGHYFGIQLASGTFQAGDVVLLRTAAGADTNGDKVRIFKSNAASAENVLVEGAEAMIYGDNYVTLPETNLNQLYLRRGTDEENYNKDWNPYIVVFAVYRPYPNPLVGSMAINSIDMTINNAASPKTITGAMPSGTNFASLSVSSVAFLSNDPANTDGVLSGEWNALTSQYEGTYTVTDKDGDQTEYSVVLTEALPDAETPVIATDLTDHAYCAGEVPELDATANAVSDGGTLSYQWYDAEGAIDGATNAKYTPAGEGSYYCKVTNTLDAHRPMTTTSATAVLTQKAATSISGETSFEVEQGATVKFQPTIAGANATYAWYACDAEGNHEGDALGTSASYTTAALSTVGTFYYILEVVADCGNASQIFTVNVAELGKDLVAHTPGHYYGQTLKEYNDRSYEIYGFASSASDKNFLWAGAPTTSSTADNCVLAFNTSGETTWLTNSVNGRGSSYSSVSSADQFTNGSCSGYKMHYRSAHSLILKVKGYDQFSMYSKDNSASSGNEKFLEVSIDGVVVKSTATSSETVHNFDLTDGEHIIVVRGNANSSSSNNEFWQFALRLPVVATVDETDYLFVQDAIDAASDPITITMLEDSYEDIVIANGKDVTIDGDGHTLNNLTVQNGGKVNASSALTVVDNLYLEAQAGASGQVLGATNVTAGAVYMDIKFFQGAETLDEETAGRWYMISAPFDVNLNGGFSLPDGTAMTFGTSDDANIFDLFEYDGTKRASTGKTGWKRVQGKMKAGTACLIGFNPGQPTTIRLKAASKTLSEPTSITLNSYPSGEDANANWNGVANKTFHYTNLNMDVQTYENDSRIYNTYAYSTYSFVVGTAFFIHGTGTLNFSAASHGSFRAPQRNADERYEYCVRVAQADADKFSNQMYVRASEEASASYEAGHDLETMNGTSAPCALIWSENYGMRLAIEEAPMVNKQAVYALGISTAAAGEYRIEVAEPKNNADLYLTYEGNIIWNLTDGAYIADLQKGVNNGYGLLLKAKAPSVATGVEETVSGDGLQVQKVVIDNTVFILRNGQMYDVTGKAVK